MLLSVSEFKSDDPASLKDNKHLPLYQLTVALYRFGRGGNVCSAYGIADNFDISGGVSPQGCLL